MKFIRGKTVIAGLLVWFSMGQVTYAAGESITVLLFNAESTATAPRESDCFTQGHIDFATRKIRNLAQYIKSKNIEVGLFQELYDRCNVYLESQKLDEELDAIGYPMQYVSSYDYNGQRQWMHVATFSKYPISSSQLFPTTSGSNLRVAQMAQIDTPIGRIRTYNVHTRNQNVCDYIRDFFNFVEADPYPYKLLGGDFNNNLPVNECRSVNDYLLNLPGQTHWRDFLLVEKSGPFTFTNTIVENVLVSDHPSIISAVVSSLPTATITPSPIPTRTPTRTPTRAPTNALTPTSVATDTPTRTPSPTINTTITATPCEQLKKVGDYNCNGAVNEEDFLLWNTDFSQSRASLVYFEYWRRRQLP